MNRSFTNTFASPLVMAGLAMAAMLSSNATLAQSTVPDAYRVAVILDQAHGEELLAGDYKSIIAQLADSETRRSTRFELSNNLCVAYIMAKDAENALHYCEIAVRSSEKELRRSDAWTRHTHKTDKAIALSNRGVVKALTGDLSGAKTDFESAISLRVRLDEAAVNLNRLVANRRAAA